MFCDYKIQHLIIQYSVDEHKQTRSGTEIWGASFASMMDCPNAAFSTNLVILRSKEKWLKAPTFFFRLCLFFFITLGVRISPHFITFRHKKSHHRWLSLFFYQPEENCRRAVSFALPLVYPSPCWCLALCLVVAPAPWLWSTFATI